MDRGGRRKRIRKGIVPIDFLRNGEFSRMLLLFFLVLKVYERRVNLLLVLFGIQVAWDFFPRISQKETPKFYSLGIKNYDY